MSRKFTEQRRQQLLVESYFKVMEKFVRESAAYWKEGQVNVDSSEDYRRHLALMTFVERSYQLWLLRFTGGEPLEVLRNELEDVIAAFEYQKKFEERIANLPLVVVLAFEEKDEYELALQLASACVLFHREDLLARVTAIIDPAYKGQDAVWEKLISFRQSGRVDVEKPYHKKPYTTLLQVMLADNKQKAAEKLNAYCKEWYPAFKDAPWHDGHLRIEGDEGDYFGYWAFEAGAVAYLYDIDDSKVEHMVYPRDLVAFARNSKV